MVICVDYFIKLMNKIFCELNMLTQINVFLLSKKKEIFSYNRSSYIC